MVIEFSRQHPTKQTQVRSNSEQNKISIEDKPAHDWYRFVLSFPPHLVRNYLEKFNITYTERVLDPFCGTGTTLVECKKLGIPSVGIEANPVAHFAGLVKTNWKPESAELIMHSRFVAEQALFELEQQGIQDNPFFLNWQQLDSVHREKLRTLPPEVEKLLLTNSISPLPLHKILVLRDCLERNRDERYFQHQLLALTKVLTFSISNLYFGPEVGVGPLKEDAPVVPAWLEMVEQMAQDLLLLNNANHTSSVLYQADARQIAQIIEPNSVDAVITSPPYPNEKDYTRTTRLEAVLLGFITSKEDLQALKRNLIRSNTRGVYKNDDDDKWIADHCEVQRIAEAIERRRIELGKTSGFERLYPRVTKLYFGGMARHLAALRNVLRPGAQLAYVVGDQASYLRVMIRTGELLAEIAASLGYEVVGIDLFRTRMATVTREQLKEEVVLLRWSGSKD